VRPLFSLPLGRGQTRGQGNRWKHCVARRARADGQSAGKRAGNGRIGGELWTAFPRMSPLSIWRCRALYVERREKWLHGDGYQFALALL
jgi:hypothetical protein